MRRGREGKKSKREGSKRMGEQGATWERKGRREYKIKVDEEREVEEE